MLKRRWYVAISEWDEHSQGHCPRLIGGPYWTRLGAETVATSYRRDEAQAARVDGRAMRTIDVSEVIT